MALTPVNRQEEWYQEMIDAIGEGGGSGGLPPVTASDNGKVATVVDGEWTADSNLFLVTVSSNPMTSDKTYAQIVAAINQGKTVACHKGDTWYSYYYHDSYKVYFAAKSEVNPRRWLSTVAVSSGGEVSTESLYFLPASSTTDNGSELIVKSGAWAKQQKKFIVTLTPTAQDFSGTMDKTVAEINAAYKAGQEIWFYFAIPNLGSFEFRCDTLGRDEGVTYPSFNGGMYYNDQLMRINTLTTNDGTKQTYSTSIYSLTPAT